MFNLDIVTVIIIISNVIVSFKGFKDYIFRSNYLFNIAGIQRGEQYRFFTSGFLPDSGEFQPALRLGIIRRRLFANIA